MHQVELTLTEPVQQNAVTKSLHGDGCPNAKEFYSLSKDCTSTECFQDEYSIVSGGSSARTVKDGNSDKSQQKRSQVIWVFPFQCNFGIGTVHSADEKHLSAYRPTNVVGIAKYLITNFFKTWNCIAVFM